MHVNGRRWTWVGSGVVLWAVAAAGQYVTPVRVSWTEDSATTATIAWDTADAARGTVRYGLSTNYTGTVHDGGGVHRHVVTLRGLQPGTRYFYEAAATDGYRQTASFRTAPAADAPLHFVLHGDLQGGVNVTGSQQVSDQIVQEDPDWVVQVGDLSDEAYLGEGFQTWTNFFQICSNELARAVFMPILGNHEDPGSADDLLLHSRSQYHRLFPLPAPAPGTANFAYAAGGIRFIALNTEWPSAAQTNWLARELQAAANDTNLTWVIALCHRPPYCWGEKSSWTEGRDTWAPLLTMYEADYLVSGHSHNYQRVAPIRGVRYLITGGAGGSLADSGTPDGTLLFATTCYHHVSCAVTGSVMQVRAIRSDGLVFDSETVTNRRQVRVSPAFPLRGQPAKISYRAAGGPLAGANPVRIHLGLDAFTSAWTNAPMTWNAATARWEFEFTVPAAATGRLAFVFCDSAGTNWHNNYTYNWQALLARTSVSPAPPPAGSNVTLRYEADMGPLAGATQVLAWVAFDNASFAATNGRAMTNVSGARWETTLPVPASARIMTVAFSRGSSWDDDYLRNFRFTVAGTNPAAWPPAPVVGPGSPVISADPAGSAPDNAGDNFDLVPAGPPVRALDPVRGFGSFGEIWANADATNLYLGGVGADLGGSNNVLLIFLGVDTLTDNAWDLTHKTGLPNALDFLHNLRFTEPMDLALVLGDGYGDGPGYVNFTYGGYDFGQGIYYVGTNSAAFVPVSAALLSQFHGTGTVPCATGGDASTRRTTRWEAALPWSALGAAGPQAVSNLWLGGVVASAWVSTNNRYLSRTCLGDQAWGKTNASGDYGYDTVTLRPLRLNLLHADLLGDGLSNGWRQAWFGTPAGPPADEDTDGDGQSNGQEEVGGTHPGDRNSFFFQSAPAPVGTPFRLEWPFAPGRFYDVERTTNMLDPFVPCVTGLATNRYEPVSNGYYRVRARK